MASWIKADTGDYANLDLANQIKIIGYTNDDEPTKYFHAVAFFDNKSIVLDTIGGYTDPGDAYAAVETILGITSL